MIGRDIARFRDQTRLWDQVSILFAQLIWHAICSTAKGAEMATAKAVLGTGARLSDFVSASLLARMDPDESVVACLVKHGRNSQRLRSF